MSKYDKDPRVSRNGKGYTATPKPGQVYRIVPTEVIGWCIFAGDGNNPQMAQDGEGNLAHGFSGPDTALAAVLGKPRR